MTTEDRGPVGRLLKELREGRDGVTQEMLARDIGVSPGLVGQVETGVRNLGKKTLQAVARALRLSDEEEKALVAARSAYPVWQANTQRRGGPPSEAQELLPDFYAGESERKRAVAYDGLASWSTRQLTALGSQGRHLTEDDRDEVIESVTRLASQRRFEQRQRTRETVSEQRSAADQGKTAKPAKRVRKRPSPEPNE